MPLLVLRVPRGREQRSAIEAIAGIRAIFYTAGALGVGEIKALIGVVADNVRAAPYSSTESFRSHCTTRFSLINNLNFFGHSLGGRGFFALRKPKCT